MNCYWLRLRAFNACSKAGSNVIVTWQWMKNVGPDVTPVIAKRVRAHCFGALACGA